MNNTNVIDPALKNLFEEVSQKKPNTRFEDCFLLSNPFPKGEFYEFCIDQEQVKE